MGTEQTESVYQVFLNNHSSMKRFNLKDDDMDKYMCSEYKSTQKET